MSKRKNKLKVPIQGADQQNEALLRALRNPYRGRKRFEKTVIALDRNEFVDDGDRRVLTVRACLQRISARKKPVKRAAFVEMLCLFERKNYKIVQDQELIQGLANLCELKPYWLQPVSTWKPKSHNGHRQFLSLVRHLICRFETPDFLIEDLCLTTSPFWKKWLVHIAQGRSVSKLISVTLPFTKKMGHYFMNAPKGLDVRQAVRYAQAKGLGADEALSVRIANSWLGRKEFQNEQLWERFVRVLIQAGMFDWNKINELCDYVNAMQVAEPAYSLNGRTFNSLLRRSDEWHHEVSRQQLVSAGSWEASLVGEFSFKEGKDEKEIVYSVVELTSAKELVREGRSMHHCVASYADVCARKRTAIFSIRALRFGAELNRLATLEVDLRLQRVVQAKATCNKKISHKSTQILRLWAIEKNLRISDYL